MRETTFFLSNKKVFCMSRWIWYRGERLLRSQRSQQKNSTDWSSWLSWRWKTYFKISRNVWNDGWNVWHASLCSYENVSVHWDSGSVHRMRHPNVPWQMPGKLIFFKVGLRIKSPDHKKVQNRHGCTTLRPMGLESGFFFKIREQA